MKHHFPVLVDEVIENLAIKKNGIYIDCTLGFAGHSSEILKKINEKGFLIGFDLDPYALKKAKEKLQYVKNKKFSLYHKSYCEFPETLYELGIKKVDGFLFDLGISSHQIDSEHRGFSYARKSKLDMRFNPENQLDAKEYLYNINEKELILLIQTYAEISHAKKVAKKIIDMTEQNKMETTEDLKKAIYDSLGGCNNKILSRVFQSIRIGVNDEINNFKKTLKLAPQFLKKGGRIAVISFHSIEDRIVKHFFKKNILMNEYDYFKPELNCSDYSFKIITKKPIVASKKEILANSRSKSAKLRIAELA